ncbi:MAG: translation initiation factor IF-6 [Candidatus Aenigmatarchaeota archaeon]
MSFRFLRTDFNGDPNIGMYGFATDKYCLLGMEPSQKILKKLNDILNVDIVTTTISDIELAGLFAVGNSNGLIVPSIIEDYELEKLKSSGLNTLVLKSRETALGNLILCNDKGCIISNPLKKFKKDISDILGCEVEIGEVAGLDVVGSCAIASNTGCLCHREASEEEIKRLEEILKVKVDVGSVSYGTPFIKSGVIVNINGAVFSDYTTGAELERIEEVFKNE